MDSHSSSSVRFSDTPPGSPKSCMKGSRRINFAPDPGDEGPGGESKTTTATATTASKSTSSPKSSSGSGGTTSSPKRSTKSVMIKSPGEGSANNNMGSDSSQTESHSSGKRPTDIQFQFHLSQHYEQSTPPPNCTSNGDIEDERMGKDEEQQRKNQEDERNDPQLMEIASKFVNEIIETAKMEAARRQKADQAEEDKTRPPVAATIRAVAEELFGGGTGGNPWYRRAHGAISKWVTNLCVRAQNSMQRT